MTPRGPRGGATVVGVYAENGYVLASDGAAGVTAVDWNPSVTTPRSPETVVIDSV